MYFGWRKNWIITVSEIHYFYLGSNSRRTKSKKIIDKKVIKKEHREEKSGMVGELFMEKLFTIMWNWPKRASDIWAL